MRKINGCMEIGNKKIYSYEFNVPDEATEEDINNKVFDIFFDMLPSLCSLGASDEKFCDIRT